MNTASPQAHDAPNMKAGLIANLVETMAEPDAFIALTQDNSLQLHTSELLMHALSNAKTREQLDKAIAGVRAACAQYGHTFKIRFIDHVPALRGKGDYARLIRLQETIPEALDFGGMSSVQLEHMVEELRGLE